MKKLLYFLFISLTSLLLISCTKQEKYDIVTSSYVTYDLVNNIVKDELSVGLIIKPGVEIHDYTPTSKQIISIKNSKLFVYTSYQIDEWLNNNVNSIISNNTDTFNLSENISHNTTDTHFWTDTLNEIELIEKLTIKLIELYPNNKTSFESNKNSYVSKLTKLHNEIIEYLNTSTSIKPFYFSGHNALDAFANRYNLNIVSLQNTNKPDADLTLQQLNSIITEIIDNDVKSLFIEELSDNKAAHTIKNEMNNIELVLLELHSYHNISVDEFNDNITYYDLLVRNFNNLKIALELE